MQVIRAFSLNRIVFTRLAVGVMLLPLLFCRSALDETSLVTGEMLLLLGVTLTGIGVVGRVWCFLYIAGRKNKTLITEGPYSLCRNPLYLFSLVAAVGIGFTSETMLIPLWILVVFMVAYPSVIGREEVFLRERFAGAFDAYVARVPRFWPSLKHFQEPLHLEVNPLAFRRSLQDVVWFVVACGFFEIIEACHDAGYIPVWFHIL